MVRFDPGKDSFAQLKQMALEKLMCTKVITEADCTSAKAALDQVGVYLITANARGPSSSMSSIVLDPVSDLQTEDHILLALPEQEKAKKEAAAAPPTEKKKRGRKPKLDKKVKEKKQWKLPVELDDFLVLYQRRKKVKGPDGKIVSFRDSGQKRTFAARCSKPSQAIEQVHKFQEVIKSKGKPLSNFNTTYYKHSLLERAERLEPGFGKDCDEKKQSITTAAERALTIIREKEPQSLPDMSLHKNPKPRPKTKPEKKAKRKRNAEEKEEEEQPQAKKSKIEEKKEGDESASSSSSSSSSSQQQQQQQEQSQPMEDEAKGNDNDNVSQDVPVSAAAADDDGDTDMKSAEGDDEDEEIEVEQPIEDDEE